MKKLFLKITILVVLFFIPKIVFGTVVINEVLYNATGVDTGKEYIRLYNNGDLPIDLTNWSIDPSSANYFIFPSFVLNAKSFVNIHIGASGTNTTIDLYDNGSNNMSNTAGPIALFNHATTHKAETFIDYIEYGTGGQTNESEAVKAGVWTAGTFINNTQEGKAIKLQTDGIDNNSPSDWMETNPSIAQEPASESEEPAASAPSNGAPASQANNPPVAEAGDNIIAFVNQEIEFSGTRSSDPDNDELAYAWNMGDGKLIEKPEFSYKYMYPGTYLVTLMVYDGQYYVLDTITVKIQAGQITINEFLPSPDGTDEENEWIEIYNDSGEIVNISDWQLDDATSGSAAFMFPENTLIAPKSYLVFSRQITGIALNNDKDSVRLLLPEGVVFQEINYEKPMIGKSSARSAEGFVWATPTPGMANIINPSNASGLINKNFVYQQPIKPETTKQSSEDYVINYQNANQPEIEGGYISANDPASPAGGQFLISNDQTAEFASVKQLSSNSSPINLILLIITIIFGSAFIGLLLIKFRKKALTPS